MEQLQSLIQDAAAACVRLQHLDALHPAPPKPPGTDQ